MYAHRSSNKQEQAQRSFHSRMVIMRGREFKKVNAGRLKLFQVECLGSCFHRPIIISSDAILT